MNRLAGKKIILGITGSIAAYKAAVLTRLLLKAGAEVQVVMSHDAKTFITPTTLATLSNRPALSDFVAGDDGTWNNHVDLGLWADVMLVAPASAHTMAKAAHGLCDNLLMAVYLSARCPVVFAPAMDLDMYAHPATQGNIATLRGYGNHFIEPQDGPLASGLSGKGRLAEPEDIVAWLDDYFGEETAAKADLAGRQVLITAGPTYEAIDPVRFIGNHSSGKMGYALAEAAAARGAQVTLVSGPTSLEAKHANIQTVKVRSAAEMLEAASAAFPSADIAIWSAAVADYTPVTVADQKIKKEGKAENLHLELRPTADIAATLGAQRRPGQLLVGFALETQNGEAHAAAKLESKNLDMVVLNLATEPGAGFGHDTNRITILARGNKRQSFQLKSKAAVAHDILDYLGTLPPR